MAARNVETSESITVGIYARRLAVRRTKNQWDLTGPEFSSLLGSEQRNMRRYFFDIWSGDRITHDDEGVECANDQAACRAAAEALLDLAKDIVGEQIYANFPLK